MQRCLQLIQRVVQHADLLEQEFIPNTDEVIDTFRADLLEASDEP